MINPMAENRHEQRKTPVIKARGFVTIPVGMPITRLTMVDIIPIEKSFDRTYSRGFTGETAKLSRTLSLFSKRTIAPMKYKPIAEGSVKIIRIAAFPRQDSGNAKSSPI
jgi:hypothetical protein